MTQREYIVTLHNYEDLDSFYEDMETPGGNLYIPDRAVPVHLRREISRNTHYMLTAEEVEQVKNDPRVMGVELSLEEQGLSFGHRWVQTSSSFDKSNIVGSTNVNWALLRCTEGKTRTNWGIDGTSSVSGTVTVTSSGKNVDVVIVDGHMDPNHPEFAKNADGTGGSRVVQYNWFQHNSALGLGVNGTYVYTPYVDGTDANRTDDNDHGCHVAGTAAGNTQGWARDANIYNISPYTTSPSSTYYFIDYIRYWHRNKPVNPLTGIRNPTITNHSYGITYNIPISDISYIRYQGSIINGPFTSNQLTNYGIYNDGTNATPPARFSAYEQDFLDAINDGIIVVGAAGNEYSKVSNYSANSSDDYNNYIVDINSYGYYYCRGTISAASGVICVSGVGASVNETKLPYGNSGSRIDVFSPGRYIMSSVNSNTGVAVTDSRNGSYYKTKKGGTSMSSPQVAGVIACVAETWPTITQAQALQYIQAHATTGQMTNTGGGIADTTDLQGATDRYLTYYYDRQLSGQAGPKINQGNRPSAGQAWPRPKILRYGRAS